PAAPVSTSAAKTASTTASSTISTSPAANALVATALPDAPPLPGESRIAEPLTIAPVTPEPANSLLTNTSLDPIHALLTPPSAVVKLKPQPHTHSFFDARNTFGLASLGVSLTADALSTQKGLAYPGFTEMNPIARPFVQTRIGAAAYNAGSFGLLAGLMYWAHKTEHHKLERILPFAVGSWEGLLSARNYRVIANRAR
ncbi:MAG: hypothetical protein JWM08_1485, partial [Candidatus Angelobacter sp.]|nr:hypothetical protein [Candidatus Angelobacter sp.]